MVQISQPDEAGADDSASDTTQTDFNRHRCFDLITQPAAALTAAGAALAAGDCVVLPTDTVYGIAADASNPEAIGRLLAAKRRGRDMPPPVLIGEAAMLPALVAEVPAAVAELAARFWPGALTLILRAQDGLRMELGDTHGTLAVRVPDLAVTRELLRQTGPLAVSSANLSGQPAATRVAEAITQLGDRVAVYLDGGPTPGPTGSTIVDFVSTPSGRIVRAGAIPYRMLAEVTPGLTDLPVGEPTGRPMHVLPAASRPDDRTGHSIGAPPQTNSPDA